MYVCEISFVERFGHLLLWQCAVLSVLGGLSTDGRVTGAVLDMLISARVQLEKLLVS